MRSRLFPSRFYSLRLERKADKEESRFTLETSDSKVNPLIGDGNDRR